MPTHLAARTVPSKVLSTELSRRNVLRGMAGAGLSPLTRRTMTPGTPTTNAFAKFDHIVVLMLENRSFDNLLGYLYEPDTVPRGQRFEGVVGKSLSNPIPSYADQAARGSVPVTMGTTPDNPNPDPGEPYPHVNTQLYGAFLPATNRDKDAAAMVAPYNLPTPLPAPAPMNGFVADYIANFTRTKGRPPTYDEYRVIMECFPPSFLPTVSGLAKGFAVCDHWHCAVPGDTFCNRSFFHAASSSGFVFDTPVVHWVKDNRAPTIFQRIDAAKDPRLTWKIYYDETDVIPLTALIHYPVLRDAVATNCFPMSRFLADAQTGQLPSYAFIEPRLFIDHNDMHPPVETAGITPPSSVLAGDRLVHQIYDAIRQSNSPTGSNWQNTLLVITFDEHGGCYDHVSPPAATPPDPTAPAGQMDFRFDRLGVRVPTILVSAYTEAGTVINAPLDHDAILKTIETKWSLAPLTARDRAAADVSIALNRSTPREPSDWPAPVPSTVPTGTSNAALSLNTLQKQIVGLVATIAYDPHSLSDAMTVYEALEYMGQALSKQH